MFQKLSKKNLWGEEVDSTLLPLVKEGLKLVGLRIRKHNLFREIIEFHIS